MASRAHVRTPLTRLLPSRASSSPRLDSPRKPGQNALQERPRGPKIVLFPTILVLNQQRPRVPFLIQLPAASPATMPFQF
eukprot:9303987-Pyramimonas_sp.AAC.1